MILLHFDLEDDAKELDNQRRKDEPIKSLQLHHFSGSSVQILFLPSCQVSISTRELAIIIIYLNSSSILSLLLNYP